MRHSRGFVLGLVLVFALIARADTTYQFTGSTPTFTGAAVDPAPTYYKLIFIQRM